MIFMYELLNEIIDYGFVQLTTVNQINQIVTIPQEEESAFSSLSNIKIGNSHKLSANASKRSIHKGKLEFYIDVIERINCVIKDNVVQLSEVNGGVVNKN